ncbi:MAG TPA: hypothetical protein ENI55_00685 [Alphaproteobacteria bacterium]|nr:hypothetical protein [Alphaproteobacteria bacterium]
MKIDAMSKCCINCAHFHNSPAYLEKVFKGMNVLGSGNGSVRKDDGICDVRDIYLSSDNECDRFLAGN